MTEVFFIYGLTFLAMGIVILSIPNRRGIAQAIDQVGLIGLFGLLHGLNEWIDMLKLNSAYVGIPLPVLNTIGMILLPASFIFLVLFGSRAMAADHPQYRWLKHGWIISLLAWAAVFIDSQDPLLADIGARYFICLPGTVLTAMAFYRLRRRLSQEVTGKDKILAWTIKILSLAFCAYGLLSGCIVPKSDFLLSSLVNYDSFRNFVGLPVQVFRASCAVLITAMIFLLTVFFAKYQKAGTRTLGGIRRKITVAISYILIILAAGLFLAYMWAYTLMLETIGRNHEKMAAVMAQNIDEMIDRRIESLQGYANDRLWQTAAQAQNHAYDNMDPAAIPQYFSDLDARWKAASAHDPLVTERTAGAVAQELSDVVQNDVNIAEIFVTDAHGGLVAASEKTSDFFQADETWWQKAYLNGKGDVFIGELEYDQSANVMSLAFAVPIRNGRDVVGICKAVVNFDLFIRPLKEFTVGRTGHASLIDKNSFFLFHDKIQPLTKKYQDNEGRVLADNPKTHWSVAPPTAVHAQPQFTAWARVDHPALLKAGTPWTLMIAQDKKEVFRPLYVLLFQGILLMMALLVIMVTFSLFWGEGLVRPIRKLQDAALLIATGKLDHQIDLLTGDELEDLADAFNKMVTDLKATTTSITSLNQEISEREKLARALQESEKRFLDVLYASQDAILLISDNKFVDCNEATARMLGYATREEFLMTHPAELSPPTQPDGKSSFEKANEMMQLAHKQGFHRFEWMHRKANGEIFPVEVSLTPVSFQSKTVLHCMWIDLTKEKQAERRLKEQSEQIAAALKESLKSREIMISMLDDNNQAMDKLHKQERLLRNIINNIPCAVFWKDRRSVFLGCNELLAKAAGFTNPDDMAGKTDYDMPWTKEESDHYVQDDRLVMESGQPRLDIVETQRQADGSDRYLLTSKVPMRDEKGGVTGLLGVFIDITHLKNMEHSLRKSQDELKEMLTVLADKNRQLREAQAQLLQTEKMSAVGQLSAGLAHEIKNPLAIILLATESLEEQLSKADEKLWKKFQMIKVSAERMNKIIAELLNFSRKSQNTTQSIKINPVIETAVSLTRNTANIHDVKIQTSLNGDPLISGDTVLLQQALVNIINNAIDAIGRTGRIEIHSNFADDDKNQLRIEIRDTGPGIPEEIIKDIFNPFFTTKDPGKGTGLGLSLAYSIIEKHQGTLTAKNLDGHGAVFSITLPLFKPAGENI